MSMYNFAQHVSIELSFWMSWAVVWGPGWSDISPGSHSSTGCLGIQAPSSTNLWVILTSLSFALYSSWLHLLLLLKSSCLAWVLSSWLLDSMCTGGLWEGHSKSREQLDRCKEVGKHMACLGSSEELSLTGEDSSERKEGATIVKIGWKW